MSKTVDVFNQVKCQRFLRPDLFCAGVNCSSFVQLNNFSFVVRSYILPQLLRKKDTLSPITFSLILYCRFKLLSR